MNPPIPRPRSLAVVQARMSSSRLPGKVLKPLAGMPAILFMLARVRRARLVDEIVLATSEHASDDALAQAVTAAGYQVHRGPLDDVLARFAGAVRQSSAELLVRLTGDCPLIDPGLIDRSIEYLLDQGLDYAYNGQAPGYPDGLDVEVFRRAALLAADAEARLPSEREHVTPWLRAHPERVRAGHLHAPVDLTGVRWTVDHPDDLEVVQALVDALAAQGGPEAALHADLFDYLRAFDARPALHAANRHARNEGYAKSLRADAAPSS